MRRLQMRAITVHTLRIFGYKFCLYGKQCFAPLVQMSLYTSLQSSIASLSSYWGQWSRSRKLLVILVLVVLLLLYMLPSWFSGGPSRRIDPLFLCVESKLEPFREASDRLDVILNYREDEPESNKILPFVGNGMVGTVLEEMSMLYIKHDQVLSTPVKFNPTIHISIPGLHHREGQAVDFINGQINKIQCFQMSINCITAASQIYAHRTRPSLLVQEIRVYNPTNTIVAIDIDQIGMSDWAGAKSAVQKFTSSNGQEVDYIMTWGTVPVPGVDGRVIPIALGYVRPPESVTVTAGGTWKFQSYIIVKYTPESFHSSSPSLNYVLNNLTASVAQELRSTMGIAIKYLRLEHTKAWQKLWYSGFSISLSRAKGALNGDRINATIYYVLSNLRAPLQEVQRAASERYKLEELLYHPDRCYEGHHTLQNSKLWPHVRSMEELVQAVRLWLITLDKKGCRSMLQAGADGAIQAIILSIGELQFKDEHLEFHIHPRELHRDYLFRRINYGNNTHVNISVLVNDKNKAEMYVAMDKNDKQYYACDAGCLDAPVKLSNQWQQFPVKLTEPWTSVLYITADHKHMEILKHIIHVKEVAEAPAHEHHVIALHRHGHHYGGLPMMFWVSISFLIVVFHLFLVKLIINEYCHTEKYARGRYNL